MKKFCDMDEVSKLEGFKEKAISKDTKITHVSAHFNTFAACESLVAFSVSITNAADDFLSTICQIPFLRLPIHRNRSLSSATETGMNILYPK